VNRDSYQRLDRVIHEKGRLAMMSMLAAVPQLSFTELRDALGMTDGNITAHARTLQQAGYLAVTKSVRGGRPLTTFALTEAGRAAFGEYIALLGQIVDRHRPEE